MSLRLPLKWAIALVVSLGIVLVIFPLAQGKYLEAGAAFARWAFASVVIIVIGMWDHYKK